MAGASISTHQLAKRADSSGIIRLIIGIIGVIMLAVIVLWCCLTYILYKRRKRTTGDAEAPPEGQDPTAMVQQQGQQQITSPTHAPNSQQPSQTLPPTHIQIPPSDPFATNPNNTPLSTNSAPWPAPATDPPTTSAAGTSGTSNVVQTVVTERHEMVTVQVSQVQGGERNTAA
ncbi:hypothetical protein CPB86DRAFT_817452 [Serendipita vermifera]|nr:hypothetical protein CPB86DRAFT_817452 [Serendipita vermifera]